MSLQWVDFISLWITKIHRVYRSVQLPFSDIINIDDNNVDTIFLTKLIQSNEDQVKSLQASLLSTFQDKLNFDDDRDDKIRSLTKWLSNNQFKALVELIYSMGEENIDMIDELYQSLDNNGLSNDLFMKILLTSIIKPYNDEKNEFKLKSWIDREEANLKSFFKVELRNIYWLWFLSITFFLMKYIYVILDDKKLKMLFYDDQIGLRIQDLSFYDDYPISYLPFSIQYTMYKGQIDLREKIGKIYKDDLSRLLWFLSDPNDDNDYLLPSSTSIKVFDNSYIVNLKRQLDSVGEDPDKRRAYFRQLQDVEPNTFNDEPSIQSSLKEKKNDTYSDYYELSL